jgi:hypothetical protein
MAHAVYRLSMHQELTTSLKLSCNMILTVYRYGCYRLDQRHNLPLHTLIKIMLVLSGKRSATSMSPGCQLQVQDWNLMHLFSAAEITT